MLTPKDFQKLGELFATKKNLENFVTKEYLDKKFEEHSEEMARIIDKAFQAHQDQYLRDQFDLLHAELSLNTQLKTLQVDFGALKERVQKLEKQKVS